MVDMATGALHGLTGATDDESNPVLSPDGMQVAYSYPRDGRKRNDEEAWIAPLAGGKGADASYALDRNIAWKTWTPDSRSLLLAANDGTAMGYWLLPVGGAAMRLHLGAISPKADISVGRKGEIAFTASSASHAAELYFMSSLDATPVKLTNLQLAEDGLDLGKSETVQWTSDKLTVDGVVTYPPGLWQAGSIPLCSTFTVARHRHPWKPFLLLRNCWPHKGGSSSSRTTVVAITRAMPSRRRL
jgi:dipeptidyl aminopeptidase/acylaminoacyl peptidase